MRLLILIILPLLSCTSSNETKVVKNDEKVVELPVPNEDFFNVFLDGFKEVSLPFDLIIGSSYWMDFSEGKSSSFVIPRKDVKQYFYGNSDEKLKSSPFDQFYYGNTFRFNSNLIGVTYYGTSKEENGISGYQLVLFDNEGKLLDSLLIAGTRGLFDVDMQIEANIQKDKITLSKIELNLDEIQDLKRFTGMQKLITYQVNEDGSVRKNDETEYQVITLTINEEKNYRIEIVE